MSNSSDPLAALLNGMAKEWRLLAMDIAELADFASNVPVLDDAALVKLQSFDAMLQNIEAQANLLQALARACDTTGLVTMLDEHPLPNVRERLKVCLGLTPAQSDQNTGGVDFFMGNP